MVVCLVIDEAHKAQGSYSYCIAVRAIAASSRHFRVLALSATPGSDLPSIQNVLCFYYIFYCVSFVFLLCLLCFYCIFYCVSPLRVTHSPPQVISNLLISKIEMRTDEELAQYSHGRDVEVIRIPLSPLLRTVRCVHWMDGSHHHVV